MCGGGDPLRGPRGKRVAVTVPSMRIAILTFDGFNEIDSFVAAYMINRVGLPGWKAEITCPTPAVESARGVRVSAQQPLELVREADAVLVGSGRLTPRLVEDGALLSRLPLDPRRQLVGSQCSGALFLAKLGLLDALPACTDRQTRPFLEASGVRVLEQPFFAQRERRHGGRVPVLAVPRHVGPLAARWTRCGRAGPGLRRSGGGGVRVHLPRAPSRREVRRRARGGCGRLAAIAAPKVPPKATEGARHLRSR